jgi:hypothetical protein
MKAVIRRQDLPGLIIIGVIGIALTFLGFVKIRNASEARRWPVVTGTVTVSEVAGAIKYRPSVSYTYTIDSVAYNSSTISNMNFNTKNRSVVVEFLKKYPAGSEVKVYYNKSDPSDAILEPGTNTGHVFLLAFGIVLLIIPVLLLIFIKTDLTKG